MFKKIKSIFILSAIFSSVILMSHTINAQENYKIGDINNDQSVSVLDLARLKRQVLANNYLDNNEKIFADINNDLNLDPKDYFVFSNKLLSLDDDFKNYDSSTGWKEIDGKYYFYKENTPLKGRNNIFGNLYNFDSNGIVTFGWYTDDEGLKHYFKDGVFATGTVSIDNSEYLIQEDSVFRTGWDKENDLTIYRDEYGHKISGLQNIDNNSYYFNPTDYSMYKGWIIIDDSYHYFDLDGKLTLKFLNGNLVDNNDNIYTGFITGAHGYTHFYQNGKLVTGYFNFENQDYFIESDGIFRTGFYTIAESNKVYYKTSTGIPITGLHTINGNTYYFDPEKTYAVSGWHIINDSYHYFDLNYILSLKFENGLLIKNDNSLFTGWITGAHSYTHYYKDGKLVTGSIVIYDKEYFIDSDGIFRTGLCNINGDFYYKNSTGINQTEWQSIGTNKYYFDPITAKAKKGLSQIDGTNYYFYLDTGILATNATVDGYQTNADGVVAFSPLLISLKQRVQDIFVAQGRTPDAIFNFIINNNVYKYIEPTKSLATIEDIGWLHFVDYAMNNRYVVCYYFASITDFMFKEAGFESRIVYGTGRGNGDHYWNQVLINGNWTNYDTCNRYRNVSDAFLRSVNYTWYQNVTPIYK